MVRVIELRDVLYTLQWRHNERDGVWNHQPHTCLLNGLFRPRSNKTSKLRVTGLCEGNSPGTGEFPAQRASNAENLRHSSHEVSYHRHNDRLSNSFFSWERKQLKEKKYWNPPLHTSKLRNMLPFVKGIHRSPLDSLHKGSMMRKLVQGHDAFVLNVLQDPCYI